MTDLDALERLLAEHAKFPNETFQFFALADFLVKNAPALLRDARRVSVLEAALEFLMDVLVPLSIAGHGPDMERFALAAQQARAALEASDD